MIRSRGLMALIACLFSVSAAAGVVREDKGDTDWEVLFAPYIWATSIEGASQVRILPPLDVDAGFGDILDNLNIALAFRTEFHRGRWAFVIDPFYASLEAEASTPGSARPKAEVDMWLVEAWGSYKITPEWEVLAGARWQQQDIAVDPGLPSPPFPEDLGFGVKDDWLDWFVGARFNYRFVEKWRLVGRGDVSLIGDSDTNYNLSLFLNRRIGKTMLLNLGYRFMETDYDNFPSYAWDVRQQGLVVGYTWSF